MRPGCTHVCLRVRESEGMFVDVCAHTGAWKCVAAWLGDGTAHAQATEGQGIEAERKGR